MKRKDYISACFLMIFAFACVFSVPCFASENQYESYGDYIEAFDKIKEKFTAEAPPFSLENLFSDFLDAVVGERGSFLQMLLFAVGVAILFSLPSVLFGGSLKPELLTALRFGLSAALLAVLLPIALQIEGEIAGSAKDLRELTVAASELMLGTVAASGGVKTAAAESVTVALSMTAIGFIGETVLPPLLAVVCVCSLLASVDPGGIGDRISSAATRAAYWAFGILSALFLGVLALQSAVGSAEDSLSLRAAKLAASDWIPVIGSSVSSAMGTVIAGMKVAGSVIGSGTVVILLSLAALPLLKAVALRLSFGLGSFVSDLFCDPPLSPSGIFNAISRILGLLIAYEAFCFLICTVQSLLLLKGGVNI